MDGNLLADPVEREIEGFANLPSGWHYGRGGAIPATTIRAAQKLRIAAKVLAFDRIEAYPSVNGSITVIASLDRETVECTVYAEARVDYDHEDCGSDVEYCEGITLDETIEKLFRVKHRKWN